MTQQSGFDQLREYLDRPFRAHQDRRQRREQIRNDLFQYQQAHPEMLLSVRDAMDRAAKIATGAEAVDLLRRAQGVGDEVLAKAVAAHAIDQAEQPLQGDADWADAVHEWAADTGNTAEVEEYAQLGQQLPPAEVLPVGDLTPTDDEEEDEL